MTLLLSVLASVHSGTASAGTPSLEVISAWGGPVNDVEVAPGGNIAYIAAGRRLVIADITNLAAITQIGSVDLGRTVRDVAVQGSLAYVGTDRTPGQATFYVVNVANLASPSIVWDSASTPFASTAHHQIGLYGGRLYARHDTNGEQPDLISVYDLAQPAAPVRLGFIENIPSAGSRASEMEVVGDRLYVFATGGSGANVGLTIHDLNAPNPLQPTLLGTFPVAGECKDLAVDGDYAYLSIGSDAVLPISIVNIANPASPTLVSTSVVQNAGEGHGIGAFDGHLYVSDWSMTGTGRHALRVYNVVANPAAPIELSTFQTHGDIRDIVFSGPAGRGWLLDNGEGAIALNIATPASLVRLGHYYSPATLTGIDKPAGGNLLYVCDAWNGFTILDVSNLAGGATPAVVGVFQTPAPAESMVAPNWAIDVVGNRAWFTAGHNGLMVVDVLNPASPTLLFTDDPANPIWAARAVEVKGGIAYVTFTEFSGTVTWGMRIRDSSTLALLSEPFFDAADVQSIAVNDQGFVFAGAHPPKVVDASNPGDPVLINNNAGPTWSHSVALDGNIRLLARGIGGSGTGDGLYLHNVSSPASPSLTAFSPSSAAYSWLANQNHRAYVVDWARSCHVYDYSDAGHPQLVVTLFHANTGGDLKIAVDEPHAYISSGGGTAAVDSGLVVLRGENLDLPPPIESSKMYWVDNTTDAVKRANTNGSGVETIVDASDGVLRPSALALDLVNGKMYFPYDVPAGVDNTKIQRANIDGSGTVEDVLVGLDSTPPNIIRVDVGGGKIYWTVGGAPNTNLIRANLDGSSMELLHQLNAITGFDLDLAQGKIYWTLAPDLSCVQGQGRIQRSNLDGSNVEDVVVGLSVVGRIEVDSDGGKMYWHDRFGTGGSCLNQFSNVYRADLDGTNLQTLFAVGFAKGIDVAGGKVYVIASGTIKRANLDGTGLEDLITAGVDSATSIQVVPSDPCPADINNSGAVDVDDLIAVILGWGPCEKSCPGDTNNSGAVDVDDLIAVILGWGPCD